MLHTIEFKAPIMVQQTANEYRLTIIAEMDGREVRRSVTGMVKGLRTPTGRRGQVEAMAPLIEGVLHELLDAPVPVGPPDPAVLSVISASPILSKLPGDAQHRVAALSKHIKVYPGQRVCAQGEPADGLYLLVSGRLSTDIDLASGERLVLSVEEGPLIVGDIAAFDGGPRTASVAALSTCDVIHIPQKAVDLEVKSSRAALLAALETICARLRRATETHAVALAPLRDRVLRCVLRMAEEVARNNPARSVTHLPLTQTLIAEMVGATRSRVSEVLRDLEAEGILTRRHGHIDVHRPV